MPDDLNLNLNEFKGLTSLWIKTDDDTHFFVNILNKKIWTEYFSGIKTEYRFYKYNGTNLILQNIDYPDLYVILKARGFAKDSLENIFDPNIELINGSWHTAPIFPDGKLIKLLIFSVYILSFNLFLIRLSE